MVEKMQRNSVFFGEFLQMKSTVSYSYKQFFEKRIRFGNSVPIIIKLLGDVEARGDKSFPKLFVFIDQLGMRPLG